MPDKWKGGREKKMRKRNHTRTHYEFVCASEQCLVNDQRRTTIQYAFFAASSATYGQYNYGAYFIIYISKCICTFYCWSVVVTDSNAQRTTV